MTDQPTNPQHRREQLVHQIQRQGIHDSAVLDAIASVPRECFVAAEMQPLAYQNTPLPIGHEQTISQPFMVALMAEALQLQPTDRVLEIGTGSGYAAAVLAQIVAEVVSVERFETLADQARERLRVAGYANVRVCHGDGTLGWATKAPFDAISVAAGGRDAPPALLEQLRVGGRMVIPLGPQKTQQQLIRITKLSQDDYHQEELAGVRFVPLIGESGWDADK